MFFISLAFRNISYSQVSNIPFSDIRVDSIVIYDELTHYYIKNRPEGTWKVYNDSCLTNLVFETQYINGKLMYYNSYYSNKQKHIYIDNNYFEKEIIWNEEGNIIYLFNQISNEFAKVYNFYDNGNLKKIQLRKHQLGFFNEIINEMNWDLDGNQIIHPSK